MKPADLDALLVLAETRFAAVQAQLAALTRQETALREQLASLARDRAEQSGRDAADAAVRAGADVRWHRWIDSRRLLLNQELAQLRARRLRQVKVVKAAFGRKEALVALAARVRAADRQQRARRADQVS